MTRPRQDESPEGEEEFCREILRERRDRHMFAIRLQAYLARVKVYEDARREGRIPPDLSPPE